MRQSGYDFADLAEDLRQFVKGTVQRGSTHLDNAMVETTSQAVKDLADKIDGVAHTWGYVCTAHGPSWNQLTTAHVFKAQERYDTVQGAADVLCGSKYISDQGQALLRAVA